VPRDETKVTAHKSKWSGYLTRTRRDMVTVFGYYMLAIVDDMVAIFVKADVDGQMAALCSKVEDIKPVDISCSRPCARRSSRVSVMENKSCLSSYSPTSR